VKGSLRSRLRKAYLLDPLTRMPSNPVINEPTGANRGATSARWVATGACAVATATAPAGTTATWVQKCGGATATNIAIGTRIAVDTKIATIETIKAGIARTATETIEATTMIDLGGA
jgi:hypothetical protein